MFTNRWRTKQQQYSMLLTETAIFWRLNKIVKAGIPPNFLAAIETTDRMKKTVRDAKMGRTSSITMPSMVGIVGAGCRRKSVIFFCLLSAGLRVAQPCRYCFYSVVQKWVFRTAGATRCPDKREIWHGPLPRAKFHVSRGRNVRIQPPKLSKFRILAVNFPLRGDSFALFLRNSQRLYASICTL